ncbi:11028_t:CDS:10 [Entrophospora sp. SA101]|nr:11736_t:CDS:10 [Entrophospora sp. SA101]CAJ0763873.1 11028_t:CDS:10 [Entrophospora sp. SA101]CAJ0908396.1 6916_t:CDS:10 [Entrophospora sp. SA101]
MNIEHLLNKEISIYLSSSESATTSTIRNDYNNNVSTMSINSSNDNNESKSADEIKSKAVTTEEVKVKPVESQKNLELNDSSIVKLKTYQFKSNQNNLSLYKNIQEHNVSTTSINNKFGNFNTTDINTIAHVNAFNLESNTAAAKTTPITTTDDKSNTAYTVINANNQIDDNSNRIRIRITSRNDLNNVSSSTPNINIQKTSTSSASQSKNTPSKATSTSLSKVVASPISLPKITTSKTSTFSSFNTSTSKSSATSSSKSITPKASPISSSNKIAPIPFNMTTNKFDYNDINDNSTAKHSQADYGSTAPYEPIENTNVRQQQQKTKTTAVSGTAKKAQTNRNKSQNQTTRSNKIQEKSETKKITEHNAPDTSDSSTTLDSMDIVNSNDSATGSSSESDSDNDSLEEQIKQKITIDYMVELRQRTRNIISEYDKCQKIKIDKFRELYTARLNNRKNKKDTIHRTKTKRGIQKTKGKIEKKKATRKLKVESNDFTMEVEEKDKEQRRTKQKEKFELAERRRIWKDIARNAIPKVHKIVQQSINSRISNCRKIANCVKREAIKGVQKSSKSQKDIQSKCRQAMRQSLGFWRKNEKEERECRKKAEKEAMEKLRVEEEMREARRQARKLNFLITQTELYSHFVGKKIGTHIAEETTETTSASSGTIESASSSSIAITTNLTIGDIDLNATNDQLVESFKDINFDNEDESSLKMKALASAQNALAQVKQHTQNFDNNRITNRSTDMTVSNADLDNMNFQNPSSMPSMAEIKQPNLLQNCTLKEYQLKGLNWLANLYEQGINGILADEMGLGKTVQSISLMAYLAESQNIWGPFVVVAPSSTLHNWEQEIARFVPDFKILPYWGKSDTRKVLRKTLNKRNIIFNKDASFHVVITSYQLVVQDKSYFEKTKWQYMILDEAQAIKSSSSARWKTLLGFQCRNRLLLTGTPIQNSMQELWALLHFIMPTLFDSHQEFSEWFSKDIESHAENKGSLNEFQLKRLHMILKPFMLRRVKKTVQNELGEKIEKDVFCTLTARQRMLYRGLREKISISELLEHAVTLSENDTSVDSLMNLVMQFRKVCNHPELFERADVTAPYSFCSYSNTCMISREGDKLYLPYSTKNLITYRLPKLVYRGGAMLDVPGKNSNAGFRKYVLDHLMNIWSPGHIHESSNDDDAFGFLRFIDKSPSEASSIYFSNTIEKWLIHLLNYKKNAYRMAYLTNENFKSYPTVHNARFLINETSTLSSANVEDSDILTALTTIFERITKYEIQFQDPSYMPKVIAPPIQIVCHDKCFYNDQERIFFEPAIRTSLTGIIKLLPGKERKINLVGQYLEQTGSQGIYGQTYFKSQGISYMQIPAMKRLIMDSGKLATLDKLLEELKAGGHRVLIYFQMTRMIDLMEEYLAYRQYKYLRLDGSSKISDRRDMVEDWQSRSDIFIFLLSTRAGGLGINLTAADTVIFYDSDWNPTVDQQAMDRAHRLGQTKQVTVYRLITKGTIEERILQRAKQKDEIQRVVISGGEFKQVDFKPREIVSLLLDDDELEAKLREQQLKRKADNTATTTTTKKGRISKRPKKKSDSESQEVVQPQPSKKKPVTEEEKEDVTTKIRRTTRSSSKK